LNALVYTLARVQTFTIFMTLGQTLPDSCTECTQEEPPPLDNSDHGHGCKLLSVECTKLSFGCTDITKITKKKLITVCMHGDETCGMYAVNELIKEGFLLQAMKLSTIKLDILLANPRGVKEKKRFIDVNLNRIFHEDKLKRKDKITETPMEEDPQLADNYEVGIVQEIANAIAVCDEYIDIHSTSASSQPFALPAGDPESEKMATSFSIDFVIEKLVKSVQGTSVGWANVLGKKAICFECGQHQDRTTIEVAKRVIKRFVSDTVEGTAKSVLTCETNQVIKKGFRFVSSAPHAFEKVMCNQLLAVDDEVGEIRCKSSEGAFIIMPTANPILGEEAWFWGEVKDCAAQQQQQAKTEATPKMNVNSIRRSLTLSNSRTVSVC